MDLLALYAQATPDKTALVDDHDGSVRQLTYAELDAAGQPAGERPRRSWCRRR